MIVAALAVPFCVLALVCRSEADEGTNIVYLTKVKGPDGALRDWSEQERLDFYHTPEGNWVMPYDWFLALEQKGRAAPFLADDHISRYRFIPDSHHPDKLPVGFTKEDADPKFDFYCDAGDPRDPAVSRKIFPAKLGFNCAACHTGLINYTERDQAGGPARRHVIFLDGGASMQNNLGFTRTLLSALEETFRDTEKFVRFAQKVLAKDASKGLSPKDLRACVNKYLDVVNAPKRIAEAKGMNLYPIDWGFGRLDALGRGGNTLLMKLDPGNIRTVNAPVSIPPIWEAWKMKWVQWNGAIQNLEARYLIQALALNAGVQLTGVESGRFSTSVNWSSMDNLARQFRELAPPRWPETIFNRDMSEEAKQLQRQRAADGKRLYQDYCAGCHVPSGQSKAQYGGKPIDRYDVKMISLDEIGTDPAAAYSFFARTVKTGALEKKLGGPLQQETILAAEAAQYLTTEIMKKQNRKGWEDNTWRAPLAYIARRHAGVWATAPFLHNGSVPNLYELLSPLEERSKTFCLGSLEFDPERVGYKTDACVEGEAPFDTTLPGNSNAGHEFRNDDRIGHKLTPAECEALRNHSRDGILGCAFTEIDRWALIEYIKSF